MPDRLRQRPVAKGARDAGGSDAGFKGGVSDESLNVVFWKQLLSMKSSST